MERDAGIDQIKRELAILQARYALYRRSGRMLRGFFVFLMPVVALAIKLFLFDALYGLFFAGMVLLFAVAITLSLKSSGVRWIDIASQSSPRARSRYGPHGLCGHLDFSIVLQTRPSR